MAADDLDLRLKRLRDALEQIGILTCRASVLGYETVLDGISALARRTLDDTERLTADELASMAWWNGLTETERARWRQVVGLARPADAWEAFRRQQGEASP